MLTCVQIQFKCSSREIDQQVKQYEKSNVKARLKNGETKDKKTKNKSLSSVLFFPH